MRRRELVRASALASAAALLGSRTPRAAGETINEREPVDLELVLAVDVSASISEQELELQLTGYAEAFRDPALASRVRGGAIGAIDFATDMFAQSGFEGTRRIVDISGDGINNAARPGRTLRIARNAAMEAGIVLNGLVILNPDPSEDGRRRTPPDGFYRDWVIGGPGSFMVVAEGFGSFAAAIRRKLIREIAAAEPGAPIVERVRSA